MTDSFDIDNILSQLTLEEKIGLVGGIDFWHTYPISRLNIPKVRFTDGPNGIRGTRFFNGVPLACFPCGTGLAATFDHELLLTTGKLMNIEAKFKNAHVILGPTMNIQRGPLGGREFESFSEDPYLTGQIASAIIKGIQYDNEIGATVKHYVCNDLEDERSASDSLVTPRALREIYLEPFRIAIKESNPICLMTGYNKVNGEHVSQSKFFLQNILRDEWNWQGTIISDWYGTYTSKKAIENGLDLEMPGSPIFRNKQLLTSMIKSKELHIKHLDDRVKNVLKLIKFAKQSSVVVTEDGKESSENNTQETRDILRKLAQDSIVLLKNDNNLLPLKRDDVDFSSKSIAIIGPNAKIAAYSGGGSATLPAYYTTTPYNAIVEKLSSISKFDITSQLKYTIGAKAYKYLPELGPQVINPKTGKPGFSMKFYKKPKSVPNENRELFDELDTEISDILLGDYYHKDIPSNGLYYIDFECEFTPSKTQHYEFGLTVHGTAQLFIDDKLVVDNKTKQIKGVSFLNSGTIEERGSIELHQGKTYKIIVEYGSAPTFTLKDQVGEYFGGGIRLGMNEIINDDEQEIINAVNLAKSVDLVILIIGLNKDWESESYDRPDMKLPGLQDKLIESVLDVNPNTIIVNQSGTPVEFSEWLDKLKALLHCWYGGNESGNAIADILFGNVNPNGKLSLTFPLKNNDNPTFLNFKTERGRVLYGEDIFVGYRYYEKLNRQVAFPFGFGLSYTKFEFFDLKLEKKTKDKEEEEEEESLVVSLSVKNIGKMTGSEVIQVYVSKVESDVIRPIKELKGFTKVNLQPNETKSVNLKLIIKDSVSFFDEYANQWSVQLGQYKVHVGNSSDNIPLTESFTIEKSYFWSGL